MLILAFIASGAVIASLNYILGNWSISSGGGRVSSSNYTLTASVGQSIIGKGESENYKTGVGYVDSVANTRDILAAEDLESAYVYPNPYKPGSGGDFDAESLTFCELTEQAEIQIFNIAGELVAEIEKESPGNKLLWVPENKAGNTLASGVYVFYIHNDGGQKKKGKFAIIK